jgi:hypothetical protein
MEQSKIGDSTLYPSKHGYRCSVGLGAKRGSTSFSNYFKTFLIDIDCSYQQPHYLYSAFAPEIMVDLRPAQSILAEHFRRPPMGHALMSYLPADRPDPRRDVLSTDAGLNYQVIFSVEGTLNTVPLILTRAKSRCSFVLWIFYCWK